MAMPVDILCLSGASAVAIVAAGFDLRTRQIPDRLTWPAVAIGITCRAVLGGWRAGLIAFAAALLAFLILRILYALRTMGGGDVKLLTAVAAFASMPATFEVMFWTAMFGGVMAVLLMLFKGQLGRLFSNTSELLEHNFKNGLKPHPEMNLKNPAMVKLPYAVPIAAACLMVLILRGSL